MHIANDSTETESQCIFCEQEPVFNKTLQMGARCYRKFQRVNGKYISGKERNANMTDGARRQYMRSLINKKGQQFVDDILSVEKGPFRTMIAVAEKHHITRERVRQIYEKMTGRKWREVKAALTASAEREIGCKFDPRNKLALMPKNDTAIRRGTKAEVMFLAKCEELGFSVSCPSNRHTDLIVNGFNIEVKLATKLWRSSAHGKTLYLHAQIKENEFKTADFVAAYSKPIDSWFIVPIKEIPDSGCLYICEKPSGYHTAKNRFWQYKEAWHLLTPTPN